MSKKIPKVIKDTFYLEWSKPNNYKDLVIKKNSITKDLETIYNNNIVLGTINATYEQVIPSNASIILQLPVNLQLGGILTDISAQLKKTGTNFEINGSVQADLITVPIDLNYTF